MKLSILLFAIFFISFAVIVLDVALGPSSPISVPFMFVALEIFVSLIAAFMLEFKYPERNVEVMKSDSAYCVFACTCFALALLLLFFSLSSLVNSLIAGVLFLASGTLAAGWIKKRNGERDVKETVGDAISRRCAP